jgi:hypothetical protein
MKPTLDISQFSQLATGELFQMYSNEVSNGGYPVDTSDPVARSYSPFVLYIEPPEIIFPKTVRKQNEITSTKIPPFASPLRNRAYLATNVNSLNGASISSNARNPIYSFNSQVTENNTSQAGLSDRLVALDIVDQFKQLKDLPPLVFLTNPQSLGLTFTKVQQYSERTRFGYVFQAWGEDLPDLDIQCKSGAFIAYGNPDQTATGLQFASMRDSASFRQILAILAMYRNGATIRDRVGRSEVIHEVGRFVIEYDGTRYKGSLESFDYGYDESQMLGGMDFNFKMKVHEMTYFEPTKAQNTATPKTNLDAENTELNQNILEDNQATKPVGSGVLLPTEQSQQTEVNALFTSSFQQGQ